MINYISRIIYIKSVFNSLSCRKERFYSLSSGAPYATISFIMNHIVFNDHKGNPIKTDPS